MVGRNPQVRIVIAACFCILFWAQKAYANGEGLEQPISWLQLETKFTIVNYQSKDQLKKFNDKINYESRESYLNSLSKAPQVKNLSQEVTEKMDSLFERVQQILDMRKRMKRVSIMVYLDRLQLDQAYQKNFNEKGHLRAWYSFKQNRIFINVNDVHDGMLAHEMAHAIIDHYLKVRPPKASAEILARYVDTHL